MSLATLDRTVGLMWVELLRHLWQSALVLAPLFLVAHVLRSAPARWSHRLWVAALAKLFIPLAVFGPLVGAAWQRLFAGATVPADAGGLDGFRVFVTVLGATSGTAASRAIERFPAPFFMSCTVAYVGLACWLMARTSRDLFAARRLTRAALAVEGERGTKLDTAARAAGIPTERVVVSDANVIPALVGTLRPRIVLPARLLEALDVDELKAVLLHEEMHRRNADPAIAFVQRLASSLLFFFPLLAPLQRRLRESAELRCDEDALRAGAEPHAYVRALARTIQLGLDPSPALAALGDGDPSLVARRLAKLREPWRTKTMMKHRVAIAAAACILATGVFLPVAPAKVIARAGFEIPELDRLWNRDQPISLNFENATAATVLDAIAAAGNIHIATEGPRNCCLVTVSMTDVRLKRALEMVAAQTDLRYEVQSPDSLRARLNGPLVPWQDDGITYPVLVSKVNPVYPKDARNARVGGKVVVTAVIREDGTIGDVEVVKHVEGWPSLDEAAVAAIRQRVYRPAMKDGHPVSIYFALSTEFRIE